MPTTPTITAQKHRVDLTTRVACAASSTKSHESGVGFEEIPQAVTSARAAQLDWAATDIKQRLEVVRRVRECVAARISDFVDACDDRVPSTVVAAEVLPLLEACRFLEREARRLLKPRRAARRSRPDWLRGVTVDVTRQPLGLVLVIAPSNYPLMLPGIQLLQALVAGNAVLLKPAPCCTSALMPLIKSLRDAGLPKDLVHLLPESPESVSVAVRTGIDKVVLTGSAETGRAVGRMLADHATPAAMELSGSDAVFVLPGADMELAARCVRFGLTLNDSATCIAPRRLFVPREQYPALIESLRQEFVSSPRTERIQPPRRAQILAGELVSRALRAGATLVLDGRDSESYGAITAPTILQNASPSMDLLRNDVFAPVLSIVEVENPEEALKADAECPYALGATIFGDRKQAAKLARRLRAGCVVVNDMIAPTGDPRVPFGGSGASGYGVTRGPEGLLEMTRAQATVDQRSQWRPHLDASTPHDAVLLTGLAGLLHQDSPLAKLRSLKTLFRAALAQRKYRRQQTNSNPDAATSGARIKHSRNGIGEKTHG